MKTVFVKSIATGAVVSALCTGLLFADTWPNAPVILAHDVDEAVEERTPRPLSLDQLPKNMRLSIERSPDKAIRRFSENLARLAPDGVLTHEKIDIYSRTNLAAFRASEMRKVLSFDLNFDGIITSTELHTANPGHHSTGTRIEVEIMFVETDIDGDGALSYDEIRRYIAKNAVLTDHFIQEARRELDLMVLDADRDGKLTIAEIITVVRQLTE